jgi:GntR family transcriptional regulator, transcriptional repressor for pyruvate dehydrogenase complex
MADDSRPTAVLGDGLKDVRRVRKAFEQVYDQLREMIFSGQLTQGQRLPTEAQLGSWFGVSRSTVREALRLLVAENLIRTEKGAGGGSFVTLPTLDHVSDFLARNVELLSKTDDVTLPQFLEARELIEVFAVRQVAISHTDEDLEALRATLLPAESGLGVEDQYLHNREFHMVLVDASGNALLRIAAQPIFTVLHTHMSRSTMSTDFTETACNRHEEIIDAIEAGDADLAEEKMRSHLTELEKVYRQIWRP